MRRLTHSLAIGTLVVALTSVAQAQDTTRSTSPGDVAKAPTFSTLMTAINSTPQAVEKLTTLTAITHSNIRIYDTKPLVNPSNQPEYNAAQAKNGAAIADLRAEIQKHDEIVKALSSHAMKLTPADVVGAQVGNDGEVVLFFRKAM